MQAYAVSYSKYMIAASMVLYTFLAYVALPSGKDVRRTCETLQRLCLGVFTINAYLTMAILAGDEYIFTFGILQLLIVLGASLLYRTLYKSANMLMINNIMMLLSIGLVMITRINQAKAQKQLLISLAGMVFLMVIPLLRSKFDSLRKGTYFYGILGIAALGAVLLLGAITNGSKISFTIAGMTFQPSEFVKILFILFMASALCEENSKSHIAILTAAALAHVGILVLSRDLGSALIFFVIYLALLFLSTGNWNILAGGLLLGLITAVICFFLFSHVRVRVQVFLDPWSSIDGNGFQITQALFAISFGGLFGAGLMQGMPSSIPFVESDFIFAAIVEEMGILFGICLILLCLNIFTDFLLLAGSYSNKFYRLYTFGTAIAFIFQAFLTIGGEVKFIPLTGVTLPLVSYGGSSVLATFIMFAIVGTIFLLQEERLERFRQRYELEHSADRGKLYEDAAKERETGAYRNDNGQGNSDQDFYKDFKGVPIYDPSKDYENMNRFDV